MTAYVYHDGIVIRGVSFVANPALERFDRISIPVEMATRFVRGTLDHRDWIVWHDTLYSRKKDLTLTIVDTDAGFRTIRREMSESSVVLIVSLVRETKQAMFHVISDIDLQIADLTLTFVFTARGDPSVVLHTLQVPAVELLDGVIEMPLPIDPSIPVDVLTRPVFPAYRVEDRMTADVVVVRNRLRGHFIDLMRFDRAATDRGLQAVLSRAEGTLRLFLAGTAVETYDRSEDRLRLLFSMPGDPTLLLHTESVEIASLREGMTMELPDILDQPFDVWSPLLYHRAAIVEV